MPFNKGSLRLTSIVGQTVFIIIGQVDKLIAAADVWPIIWLIWLCLSHLDLVLNSNELEIIRQQIE